MRGMKNIKENHQEKQKESQNVMFKLTRKYYI